MIDSTIIRAHQQAATGKGGRDQTLGRSRGGLTTKIQRLADALGRPLRSIVTAGQAGDITQAPALPDARTGAALLADKAYDSKALRIIIAALGAEAVIPSNHSRKSIIPHDAAAYKRRNRDRAPLQPAQTCPALRHTPRPTNHPIRRPHPPRRHHDPDDAKFDPS